MGYLTKRNGKGLAILSPTGRVGKTFVLVGSANWLWAKDGETNEQTIMTTGRKPLKDAKVVLGDLEARIREWDSHTTTAGEEGALCFEGQVYLG
jgi:hypothetical protein